MSRLKVIAAISLALAVFATAPALAESFAEAIMASKPVIDLRFRFESVDQDGFGRNAKASTFRARVGFESGWWRNYKIGLDFDSVSTLGSEKFNDTINGRGQYPVVADPETTEVNQAYLAFRGLPNTTVKFGRQRVKLQNLRFVANVGFRQNEQTYDALVLVNTSFPNVTAIYGYVFNVNRIFGNDHPFGDLNTDTHILNLTHSSRYGDLTAYGLSIDLDDAAVAGLSSLTFGARFAGSTAKTRGWGVRYLYAIEFASQRDTGKNPLNYSANYMLIEPGIVLGRLTLKVGYEIMEGGRNQSFQTPLATLHAFSGLTDKFLNTPVTGLEDLYLKVAYKLPGKGLLGGLGLSAAAHSFEPERGGGDYGTEVSLKIAKTFTTGLGKLSLSAEGARYNADGFSTDTTKLWLTVGLKY